MLDRIIVSNVEKNFDSVTALKDICLELEHGKVYAILGDNGSGKTTLLKHILGIEKLKKRIDKGEFSYIHNKRFVKDYKKELSYSPEIYSLYEELTVIEYLTFVAKVYNCSEDVVDKMQELIKIFNLKGCEERYICNLSNGMKKKVSHVAALMIERSFCFLDEPFLALDTLAIINLKRYISNKVKEDFSFIISTDQIDVLEDFNIEEEFFEILLLKAGKLVYKGRKSELLEMTNESSIGKAYLKICN